MATTSVLFVHRRDAKALKSQLEGKSLLDKRFRMGPSSSEAIVEFENSPRVFDGEISHVQPDGGGDAESAIASGNLIAVPVTDECIDSFENHTKGCSSINSSGPDSWETYAVASGRQRCPFSTSTMGNQNHAITSRLAQKSRDRLSNKSQREEAEVTGVTNLTNIQCVLIETIIDHHVEKTKKSENDFDQKELTSLEKMIETAILSLSIKSCPKKLELIGDDRTLVVPSTAFLLSKQKASNEFHQVLLNILCDSKQNVSNETNHQTLYKIQENLWKKLANLFQSQRVVRRGDIDPESGIRESGHRILWPLPESIRSSLHGRDQFTNDGYTPKSTGPGTSGWITVTEHKISQSFDLTRVMFSRGNVTEKKRFGQLVQPNELVLDMYAGIGYYTLPSLFHGHAKHTVACEWNPNAVFALRHNLKANKVDDRATVLEGDCRSTLRRLLSSFQEKNHQYFDRISLGLLPSSEGGWPIAIECLNRENGGWLHVHGNVATTERQQWAHWLCRSLVNICKKHMHSTEWHAICNHIERVKSFAPKVDHNVADVFVGPLKSPHLSGEGLSDVKTTGVFHSGKGFTATPLDVPAPSCALDSKGIIHQEWMMSNME